MDYLPLFVELKQRPVLLVGGGHVAARKAVLLLKAGARLRVIAPQLCDGTERNKQKHNNFKWLLFYSRQRGQQMTLLPTQNK